MKLAPLSLLLASLASFAHGGFVSDILSVLEVFDVANSNEHTKKLLLDPEIPCEDERVMKIMNNDLSKKQRKIGCNILRTFDKIPSVSQAASCAPTFVVGGPPAFFVCLGVSQQMANSFVEAANTCYHQCVAAGHENHRGSASKVSHSCKEFCVNN